MRKKLIDYNAVKLDCSTGKEVWTSKARNYLKNNEMTDILMQYNAEIRGFYNYYSIANNCSIINSFYSIMKSSMYKTFARKLETSAKKVCSKYKRDKKFSIPYTDSKGRMKYRLFYDEGFKRKTAKRDAVYDIIPNTFACKYPNLIARLKKKTCELCGKESETTMFQVRSLKALNGKYEWERKMIKKHRKTLAVCPTCNHQIHEKC
jgi:hypothetical protein